MLVLSRKIGQVLHIGPHTTVTIQAIVGNRVRLGIAAPRDVCILRAELVPVAVRQSSHLSYESTFARLPSGGQGTDFSTSPPSTTIDLHSLFTALLPYVEYGATFEQLDTRFAYNAMPENQRAAQQAIPGLICPSNSWRTSALDLEGFGCTDYGATYYVDVDPETGQRDLNMRAAGALVTGGSRAAEITDGLSNTIAVAEDVGRDERMIPNYGDPVTGDLRRFWRWAEPDNAFGISKPINNNATPRGGPPSCPWSQNNCGPNDEIFSFHPGGALVVMCDGSVHLLKESLDVAIVRALVTRSSGEVVSGAIE